MGITAVPFFLAAALFIWIYWKLPQRFRPLWLLLGSLGFLATWSWQFIFVLAGIGGANYLLGRKLGARRSLLVLLGGILFNLAALLLLKYNGFYLPALTGLLEQLGIGSGAGGLRLLVPLGLSFLTVQFLSYLLDIYHGRIQPEGEALKFGVYTFYFPKLLSGPIERARDFFGRLDAPRPVTGEVLTHNLVRILVGLVRKVLIADSLNALLPADLLTAPGNYAAPLLAAWLLAFAFALYNDFAGYTSIVRGISGLLGIELSENFRTPYFSRNFNEFWTRWHISLSNWLRDYIFFPLSRFLLKKVPNRSHVVHLLVPPLVTMLVSGMWHGLSWNMLVWGGLHGLYLVGERLLSLRSGRRAPDALPKWRQLLAGLLVFLCVLLAWIPFRMSLEASSQYLHGLFSPANWQLGDFKIYLARFLKGYPLAMWLPWIFPLLQTAAFLIPAFLLDVLQARDEFACLKWPRWIQVGVLALLGLAFFLLSLASAAAPFVYQGF